MFNILTGNDLRCLCQSIAVLEIILMPYWECRYYTFQPAWDTNLDLFSMRDGSGNEIFVIFTPGDVLIKGFDHEASNNENDALAVLQQMLPSVFQVHLSEPAFNFEHVTFCMWHDHTSDIATWSMYLGREDSPSKLTERLGVQILAGDPAHYQSWASEYYAVEIDLGMVDAIYRQQPIKPDWLLAFDSERDVSTAIAEIHDLGYPTAL